MTALSEYQRLEAPGLWRPTPTAQRREVLVIFGDATLVLADPKSARPLAHWSLPAVERVNPGAEPALYRVAADAEDVLEIDDPTMNAAIAKVQRIISASRPHQGRLRGIVLGTALGGLALLAIFWLPGAVLTHAASVLPLAKRAEIGRVILDDLGRLTGAPCTNPAGQAALDKLAQRLFAPRPVSLRVVPEALGTARHVPGGVIVLDRRLIESQPGPDLAAGYALAEAARSELSDPLPDALGHAGLATTFRLLATGQVRKAAFAGYGETLLQQTPIAVPDAALIEQFARAQVSPAPYVAAEGGDHDALLAADPARAGQLQPILPDADWVRAQQICTD